MVNLLEARVFQFTNRETNISQYTNLTLLQLATRTPADSLHFGGLRRLISELAAKQIAATIFRLDSIFLPSTHKDV